LALTIADLRPSQVAASLPIYVLLNTSSNIWGITMSVGRSNAFTPSPNLEEVGLLGRAEMRSASRKTPESVSVGLSKNGYYDLHNVPRLCIVKLIGSFFEIKNETNLH